MPPESPLSENLPTSLLPESAWMTIAPVTLGDYELMEELGRGAMGVVYRARQKSLGRIVALKMILAGQAAPGALARFQQEARSAAALDHPGIVPLFEVGEAEGQPFYTMAFVEGDNLSHLLSNRGALPPRQAAQLIGQIADAVDYAHQRGILHRDLKPDNILVDRQGHPRIADFGLARRIEDGPNLTSAGSIMGTPSYMSPEQAQGLTELTPAVDVYSLGGVLYALLVGHSPFTGASTYEVLLKVAQQPPQPLRQINPDLPEALERIVLRCLEKDPTRRYSSAADLAADLRAWLDTDRAHPSSASVRAPAPARQRERRRLWPVLAGAVALLGVGLAALWLLRPPAEADWHTPTRQDFDLKVALGNLSPDSRGIYTLEVGQPVRFLVESPHDVHLGIWSLEAQGVQQLLPNEFEPDTLVRAGVPRRLPGSSKYELPATPADRVEFFRIVASTRRWQALPGQKEGPFAVFKRGAGQEYQAWQDHQAELTGRGVKIRRLDRPARPLTPEPSEPLVCEVVLPYRVRPAR